MRQPHSGKLLSNTLSNDRRNFYRPHRIGRTECDTGRMMQHERRVFG
jgi:hypothetical protein